jgi:peptidoglycan/xylan/chitin deacetylase (PgdA/CDA1 family)
MERKRHFRTAVITWNVVAPLVAGVLWWSGSPWLALLAIMSAHALWLGPTLVPGCSWAGEVVMNLGAARAGAGSPEPIAPADSREVWLTIDDGPHPEDTPLLLDLLDQYGAKATFFIIGARAASLPHLVEEVVRRGHGVGNHTQHHPQYLFWAYGPRGVKREIGDCQKLLASITAGAEPRWFRAPAGFKNPFAQVEVERLGLRLACWSARGRDGVIKDQAEILSRLKAGIKPGAILLMHESRDDGKGGRLAPQVLKALLQELAERGFRCVLP